MTQLNRRQFLQQSSAVASLLPLAPMAAPIFSPNSLKEITIVQVSSTFEREPLATPYGFKGGYMTDVWQAVARMQSSSGKHSIGLGTQNTLWSDAQVFLNHSESGGNALMYAMTEKGVQLAKGQSFTTPIELQENILEEVYAYGKKITDNPKLRKTFALNALVAVDNAAWLLYAYENGIADFDTMIPEAYRPALSHRHEGVVSVPSFSFATPVSQMKKLADEGYFFLKIKLGHPGTQREMLDKDKAKLTEIHKTIGQGETSHTADGKIPYYFDMNGRYEEKDALLELLDHARKIGAFDQIVVVEEPFPEENESQVGDVGVRVAADESAHTEEDVITRIQMGYNAIALKPIAKTLSMTLKMAKVAYEQNIPCLCADLTVNPILVDWNKNVAARLAAWEEFPGMGLMENNGHQNYRDWPEMLSYHPHADADWTKAQGGVFKLGEDFYQKSGGIFELSDHYQALFDPKKGSS
ncbi:MAG: enolase C-terminal domain-like protein [Bacteroidota bacterium]